MRNKEKIEINYLIFVIPPPPQGKTNQPQKQNRFIEPTGFDASN